MSALTDQLGSGLWALLAFAVLLGAIIAVHEWGHFFVARRCGVHVIRFSIGFGKPLWSRIGRDGTEYVVAAIPLGGYVKMLDEREAPVADDQLHRAFNRKPVGQRFAIVAAGPLVNLVFAVLLYWVLFVVGSPQLAPVVGSVVPGSPAAAGGLAAGDEILSVDAAPVRGWDDIPLRLAARVGDTGDIVIRVRGSGIGVERDVAVTVDAFMQGREDASPSAVLGIAPWFPPVPPVIKRVMPDIDSDRGKVPSPASRAGLLAGDQVIAVDGRPVATASDWVDAVRAAPGKQLDVEVERNGVNLHLAMSPERWTRGSLVLGIVGAEMRVPRWPDDWPSVYVRELRLGPLDALVRAVGETWDRSVLTLASIGKLVSGQLSLRSVGGPISIAKGAGVTASLGLDVFLGFMAFLSISVGLLNLLPIPVLDGGHLVFYAWEAVRGKPLPERVQAAALQVGVVLLVALMSLAIFNDIVRVLE